MNKGSKHYNNNAKKQLKIRKNKKTSIQYLKFVLNDACSQSFTKQCCQYTATQFNTDRSRQARASDSYRPFFADYLPSAK